MKVIRMYLDVERFVRRVRCMLLFSLMASLNAAVIDTEKAELLFESGRYELAKTYFQKALDQHPQASLHYNLALTELKLNELAAARWQIEQARMRAPMQSKYRELEAHILEQLKLPANTTPVLTDYPRFLTAWHWSLLASIAAWGCLWLLIVGLHRSNKSLVRTGIFCSLLLILVGLSLHARTQQRQRAASAIVCAQSPVEFFSAPTKNAPQVGALAYGERVRVLRQHLEYIQVADSDNNKGWMPQSAVRCLSPKPSQPLQIAAPSTADQR
jgi:tetratricopeptide (TPR) repeat protein